MECLHFEISAAYFCPCFLTQLMCLKNSTVYSDRILRYVTYKNPVPDVIEVLETCRIVLINCFEHLFTQLAYLKIGMNFLYYDRRTFAKFEFEKGNQKTILQYCSRCVRRTFYRQINFLPCLYFVP